MNRREFLGNAAALAGTVFLASCGESTPQRPQEYGIVPAEWNKISPEERGDHAWKFLTTPAKDPNREADRQQLLAAVTRVIERAERKGTNEHAVLHQALDGALKKNYARFILHYRQRGVNLYNPQDAATELILKDRDQIISSPAFLRSASRVTKLNVTRLGVQYNQSSAGDTTYASRVIAQF